MKVTARRRAGYTYDVETDTGHIVVVDEPEHQGGTNVGPSPTRLGAAALASCAAITVEMYATRKGWELGEIEVDVDMDYGDSSSSPMRADVHMRIAGELSEEQRARLALIAAKCPVHRALAGQVEITDRVELS